MIPASTIIRDYLCKQCESPLKLRRDPETRELAAICTANDLHEGYIKKTTIAIREAEDTAKAFEMKRDPKLQQIPGWPQPKRLSVKQCYEELFD
jgi:hypothetical protein